MLNLIIFVVASLIVTNCNGRLLDHITPCPLEDGECQRILLSTALKHVAEGDAELDIPPIDPLQVKDVEVSILNIVDIRLIDGLLRGIKDCDVERVSTSLDNMHSTIEMRCSVVMKGHYTANAKGALIRNMLGGQTLNADGNAKIGMENFRITIELPFHPVKKDDGEIFLQCRNRNKTFDYTFEIGDKAYFNIDRIFLGKQNISPIVTAILNENWQLIMETFGEEFIDKAMDLAYVYMHKFFDAVPAKFYVLDNLEHYVSI